ncbi:hypothetical protein BDZ45DRAFT_736431 [Acephala macrosclerotiorum]|nr:hypothetical protein BDZ45DRAFT_736431 [Acephala macrosclerotiorum]
MLHTVPSRSIHRLKLARRPIKRNRSQGRPKPLQDLGQNQKNSSSTASARLQKETLVEQQIGRHLRIYVQSPETKRLDCFSTSPCLLDSINIIVRKLWEQFCGPNVKMQATQFLVLALADPDLPRMSTCLGITITTMYDTKLVNFDSSTRSVARGSKNHDQIFLPYA